MRELTTRRRSSPLVGSGTERLRTLAQAALVVLTGFLASRVLGLVRNMVIAAHFGAEPELAAYLAAIAVPDFVFQVFVGGAVGSAFIPVFKGYLAEDRRTEAWRLTSSVVNAGVLVTGLACLLLGLFARPVMDLLLAGSVTPELRDLAADLLRILLVSPAIFAASTFLSSALNSFHRFAVAALAPITYNLAIIGAVWLLSDTLGVYGLALGAVAGSLLHLLVQVPAVLRLGMRWQPVVDLREAGVREVGRLFAPRMLGLGAVQLNRILSGIVLASFFGSQAIVYLDYAWLMLMTPLALAMAVGTAVFPTLSEEGALGNRAELRRVFLLSLRMILFLSIPASVGLMVLGEPLIRLFLERGRFDPIATNATAYALVFFAIGLAGHATVEIVDRAFYALHDTRTPVLAALGAMAANIGLGLLLMQTPLGYGGLALANSLAVLGEATLLMRLLAGRLGGVLVGDLSRGALRMLAASLVMGLPIALAAQRLEPLAVANGSLGNGLLVAGGVLAGALIYAAMSYAFRSEELGVLVKLVRR